MAKNLKGGYKIVSLNGLDLVGESLAIAGLYDKLAKSYDKPILVTGIVIDGEKKKNAFVQVEVLDDGIKINDLYGYDLLVKEDGGITVSANPQELPNTADASAGQVLKLDAQKKPVWGDEAELPDTASASQGNALLLDAEKKPVWGAVSGGTRLCKIKLSFGSSYPESTYEVIQVATDELITKYNALPETGTDIDATIANKIVALNGGKILADVSYGQGNGLLTIYTHTELTPSPHVDKLLIDCYSSRDFSQVNGFPKTVWSIAIGEEKTNKLFSKELVML